MFIYVKVIQVRQLIIAVLNYYVSNKEILFFTLSHSKVQLLQMQLLQGQTITGTEQGEKRCFTKLLIEKKLCGDWRRGGMEPMYPKGTEQGSCELALFRVRNMEQNAAKIFVVF